MLPHYASAPRSRRFVDHRGTRTTVTRKSAPARIAFPPQGVIRSSDELIMTAAVSTPPRRLSRTPTAASRNAAISGTPKRIRTLEFESTFSSEDDSDSDSSYNSFIESLRKKDVLRLDNQLNIDDPLSGAYSNQSRAPSPTLKPSYHSQATTFRVLKSYYEGNIFGPSRVDAQLMVGPAKKPGQQEFAKPLFKWIHVENPEMNFGAYMEYVTKCPYLSDAERDSVLQILRTAREKSDRSLRMPPDTIGSYVEPEYFEETIESTVYQGPRAKRAKKEVIRWIAIPYFYLMSGSISGDKPGTELDLIPQYAKKGSIAKGGFFQVAQFWCLLLGDGLMISCARLPISDVPKNLNHLTHLPPADPARPLTGDRAPGLQVGDGGLRLWLLPLEECETWSAFVAHFIALGFSLVDGWQVKFRGVVLDSADWNSVLAMAKKGSMRLELSRSDNEDADGDGYSSTDNASVHQPSRSISVSSTHDGTEGRSQTGQPETLSPAIERSGVDPLLFLGGSHSKSELQVSNFHVFTLLATVAVPQAPLVGSPGRTRASDAKAEYRIDERQLDQDLRDLDEYLSNSNARQTESLNYSECPTKTTYDVENSCSTLDSSDRGDYVSKRTLVRAVQDIFELFFPLRYEHRVTLKFWGSINRLIQTKDVQYSHFAEIVRDISQLGRLSKEVKQEIFSGKEVSQCMTTVPDEFIQAWILIQMCFVCFSAKNARRTMTYIRRGKERLLQGRLRMIEQLQTVNIRDREAVLPLGVTALLLGQLLHDSQGPVEPERHRLTSAYWTFFKGFKAEVYDRPLNRKYEATFTSLKTEFETIIGTLEDQQRVLIALEDSINEAESHSFANSSSTAKRIAMEPSREASATEYLLHQTEEMLQNLSEMSRRLHDLENYHFLCLSIDNDMQQKASFAFTTVTVFFLPLTTLTGILGMNTSDIRNMPEGQWLFWVVGVPLGVACLSAWFVYLGSFEKLWRWSKKKSSKKKKLA